MEQLSQNLINYLSQNWQIIKMHKKIIGASLLLGFILGVVVGYWYFYRQLEISDRSLHAALQDNQALKGANTDLAATSRDQKLQIQSLGDQITAERDQKSELQKALAEATKKTLPAEIGAVETKLFLQYPGDGTAPTQLSGEANLHRWYSAENRLYVSYPDEQGQMRLKLGINTNLVWIFERPTTFNQPIITFSGGELPEYEVKDTTQKYVFVSFSNRIPKGILELSLKQ
jgi:hypothetical protein